MKKFLKIFGFSVLGIIIILYVCFLFVLPKAIDLNKYSDDLKKIVNEQSALNLSYDNISLITTPFLGAGIKADNVVIKLPDDSILLSTDSLKAAVSLPKLLFYTVKSQLFEFENPFINAEIMQNGEDYKIVKLIEDILNTNKQATFGEKPSEQAEEESKFDFDKIKIILPNIKFNNYKVLITDNATNNYLDLHGEKLIVGYFNGKRLKVKTKTELFSNENKNITADININTILPAPSPKLDTEDDPAERIDIPFINPVTTYQNYDLKTNIDAKLKINANKKGKLYSFGHVNVENLTMKVSTLQLPKSYMRIKTFGTNVDIDTDIHTTEEENVHIFGNFNYGVNPKTDLNIKTADIKFENLLALSKAVLESLQIPNELKQYKAQGTLKADCSIKTNFKKLKSNGFIKIENGALSVRNLGEVLSKININLILDDNVLNIKDSKLSVSGSEIKINGLIDEKSYTDVDITTKNLPLAPLFDAFADAKTRNNYTLESGNLSSTIKLQGKMKEAVSDIRVVLKDFSFADKFKTFDINNKNLDFVLKYESKNKNLTSNINNKGFQFILPKTNSKFLIPNIEAEIRDKNIELMPNLVYFNDNSAILYSGSIYDYERLNNINFLLQGSINTEDIIKFIGSDMKPFLNSKGKIPIEVTLNGNSLKQTLFAQALTDSVNYITPVDFNKLQGLKTSLQAKIDFKPGRIKIKETGLYTRAVAYDENGQEKLYLNKIIGVDGTFENNTINLLKIDIPQTLNGKISIFPQSEFKLDNSKLYVYNKMSNPLLKGVLKIRDLKIPELYTSVNSVDFDFKDDKLYFNLNKILLALSDINITGQYSLKPDTVSNIYDLNIISDYINLDNITAFTEKLMSYMPKNEANSSASSADIPVIIHNGSADLKKILTGNIEVLDTKANLGLINNVLSIKNLRANIFKGNIWGDIYVNLISMIIDTDIKGKKVDVAKALLDSSGVKDSLSGTAEFNSKLLIDGAASTPEKQMKGISGDIDFKVVDGQFGPFGRLENMILAENIRESKFFQTALGGIINSIATIDTTHFNELNGHVSLKDGICYIDPLTSKGNVMNLHILGNFDIIKNYADMKVRVKLTSVISNLLGPINAINPVNLINSAASTNVVTAKAFSLFCETVPEEEIAILPSFSNAYVDKSSTKFQLGVRGDAAKPLTLIKSFKWLATPLQFNLAKEFADSLPEVDDENANATIEQAIAHEEEKKTLKYKIKHLFKKK